MARAENPGGIRGVSFLSEWREPVNKNIAVILAAGKGSRLGDLVQSRPKPMVPVCDTPMIDNLMSNLAACGIRETVVVTGYLADTLERHLETTFGRQSTLHFVRNEQFDRTNNVYSLWLAKQFLGDGFLLFESDVFFAGAILRELVDHQRENVMVVDRFDRHMNGTVVGLSEDGSVSGMYLKSQQGAGFDFTDTFKTVNFYKFGAPYVQRALLDGMDRHVREGDVNIYYEQVIKEHIDDGVGFHGLRTGKHHWWEIDTVEDLDIASRLFTPKRLAA
jgi:choline kinase